MIEITRIDWIETTWKGVETYPLLTSDTVYEVHGIMTHVEDDMYKFTVYINVIPGGSPHRTKAVITKGEIYKIDSEELAIDRLRVMMGVGAEWYANMRKEMLV
jgi:hypothetical protein